MAQEDSAVNLARFVVSRRFEDLPPRVIEQAKLLTLDAIGAGILGSRTAVAGDIEQTCLRFGDGTECTVLGSAQRASSYVAAMINAAFVHQVELAEGVERAVVHSSTPVVPASLATAERRPTSGKRLIMAVALGCEALIRFGHALATDPSDPDALEGDRAVSWNHGWMTPDLLSPIGSATSAAVVLGHDFLRLRQAWGIAANLCPATVRGILPEGCTAKGVFMGVGCASGLLAADLATVGITGLQDLAGSWMPVVVPAFDTSKLCAGLPGRYEVEDVLFKHFATVGPLFAPLEATFELLRSSPAFEIEEVSKIEVEGYRRTLFNANPDPPRTAEAARANLGYCVSVALVRRDRRALLGDAFERASLDDPRIRATALKVNARLNERYASLHPHKAEMALVRVTLNDGRSFEQEVDLRKMAKYHFPTRADIGEKFLAVVGPILGLPRASDIVDRVWSLEDLEDIRALAQLLTAPREH